MRRSGSRARCSATTRNRSPHSTSIPACASRRIRSRSSPRGTGSSGRSPWTRNRPPRFPSRRTSCRHSDRTSRSTTACRTPRRSRSSRCATAPQVPTASDSRSSRWTACTSWTTRTARPEGSRMPTVANSSRPGALMASGSPTPRGTTASATSIAFAATAAGGRNASPRGRGCGPIRSTRPPARASSPRAHPHARSARVAAAAGAVVAES